MARRAARTKRGLALADVKVEHLCMKPVPAKNERDFMGSCIRLTGHDGRCQKIVNGMTQDQANAITAQDLADPYPASSEQPTEGTPDPIGPHD